MTCRETQALAVLYLDDELPEEACDGIQRHLLRCAPCREDIDSQRLALEVYRSACRPAAASPEFVSAALDDLSRQLDCVSRLPPPPRQLVLGIGD